MVIRDRKNPGPRSSQKKKRPGCLEFTGLVPTIWVLSQPETMPMVFTEGLLVREVFASSIKVLDGNRGQINPRRFLHGKGPIFFQNP